jgi:hypothetical protein
MTSSDTHRRRTRPAAAISGMTVTAVAAAAATGSHWCAAAAAAAVSSYGALVISLALFAALSRKRYRREAAMEVLHLLLIADHAPAHSPPARRPR